MPTRSRSARWGAYGDPADGQVLVAVVPDAVNTVKVDGQPVDFVGNVWSTHVSSTHLELRPGDSTTNRSVTITIDFQRTAQTGSSRWCVGRCEFRALT